jgi:glycosyltransferase involved in cell wall biosynthesis
MKKLNILLLNALDIYGGGEFFVFQFSSLLKSKGHKVTVSCRNDNLIFEKCKSAGIEVFPLDYPENYGKKKILKIARALEDFIKENEISIIHSNTNYDRTAGALAAKFSGIPHVTTNHSFHSIKYNLTHWYRNQYMTDHFIVDGQCTMDLLTTEDKINKDKISLIHLGMDPEPNKRDMKLRHKIRNDFGINDDIILIGNVARMVPFKGQEYLIKAFPEVMKHFPKTKLMIVGDGELNDKLRKLTKTLKIEKNTIFTGFREDMQALYSSFDIYAHTSVEGGGETFPYAVLHALAQGLPIVVTSVGDVPAMVRNEINGFVVPNKDIKGISDKLLILTGDSKKRIEMGKESHKLLLKEFTVEKMTSKIEKVYYKVIDEKK